MQDSGSGTHALHLARPDHSAVAKTVLMLKGSVENIGYNFHVIVPMAGEAGAGNDAVLVDDPQAPETHTRRVLIMREGERMAAVQPSRAGLAARHAIAKCYHIISPN